MELVNLCLKFFLGICDTCVCVFCGGIVIQVLKVMTQRPVVMLNNSALLGLLDIF